MNNLFKSHTARMSCSGRVLLRAVGSDVTMIQVIGAKGEVRDPRPVATVEQDLRSQGLSVAVM